MWNGHLIWILPNSEFRDCTSIWKWNIVFGIFQFGSCRLDCSWITDASSYVSPYLSPTVSTNEPMNGPIIGQFPIIPIPISQKFPSGIFTYCIIGDKSIWCKLLYLRKCWGNSDRQATYVVQKFFDCWGTQFNDTTKLIFALKKIFVLLPCFIIV